MIDVLIETFARERGVRASDLENPKQSNRLWITRYMIWYYLHYNHGLSATQLSRRFGRNRTSIFRGIRIIKHEFKYNKVLCAEYHNIVAKIEGMAEATPSENME